ncbi:GcrA family cell cycle regulator [Komagataeibacter sp. FNDCF1]|uniref:GcrA family cell cycle regulator n=1 Tax=Komagataeibacter sp. FNDCF1 TaxID=2878681 RepID=UPI001E5F7A4B|nr:GcrA family cell cycle regulator [Komagataeibacter sp. FNDCF1]MCE2565006.1 GcrA family cell cycle regulator [Komagataeibacter sp. FNDCF1]
MAMEWTEETIARLRDLWQQGLSTAEIGRQLSVTKNAVVGKAHRLGLKPRPSPIRRAAKTAAPAPAADTTTGTAQAAPAAPKAETAPAVPTPAPAVAETPRPPQVTAAPVPPQAPQPGAAAPVAAEPEPQAEPRAPRPSARATRAAAAALRPVSEPRRRSSQSCCWPLGDPGTPGFHFCGATPLPGKPYCAEHAQLAYVKLRDRRDNVA